MQAALNTENAGRVDNDNILQTNINNETTNRTNADTTLQNNIDTEIANRIAGDNNLKAYIDDKATILNQSITNEATARAAALNSLNDDISAKITAAKNEILNTLAVQINTLQNTVNEIDNKIEQAMETITVETLTENQSKGFAQSGSLTYNGSTQTPTIVNYSSTYHELGGTLSATSAGSYTITVSPAKGYKWYDGTKDAKEITWTIGKASLTKPVAAASVYNYTGSNVSLQVNNYDSTTMNQSGTTTASAVGDYVAYYSIKTPTNYQWADGTSARVQINWSIGSVSVAKPTASNTSFTYNGSAQSLTVSNFNEDYMSQTGTISSTNAGNFTAVFKLKTGYKWADDTTADVSISWSIAVLKLTKPTAAKTAFTYNGSAQSLSISNFNSTYESQTGTVSATKVNNYSVTYKLKNTSNTTWADGSTSNVVISWSIDKLLLAKPTAASTTLSYTGSDVTLAVSNYNSNYENQSGTVTASAIGDYSVTYSLKDTTNTAWADSTTANVVISWSITNTAISVAKPVASQTEFTFTYNGVKTVAQTLKVTGYDSNAMTQSGTTSASAAGDYSVAYTLKDGYQWSDGTSTPFTINWKINKRLITIPKGITTSFVYNGQTQEILIDGLESLYVATGNISATNVGKYCADFELVQSIVANISWTDGTTDNKKINWEITKLYLPKPTAVNTNIAYDGNEKTLAVSNFNSNFEEQTGTVSATEGGQYTAVYKLKSTDNTAWEDGSTADVSINWTITDTAVLITKPTAATTEFTVSKTSATARKYQTLDVTGYDENAMSMSGTIKEAKVGDYSVTYSLKDGYKWADGSTGDVTISWKINKRSMAKPTLTTTSYTYTGSAITPKFTANATNYYSKTGDTSATEIGNYSTTFSLYTDDGIWDDGTTEDVVINWSITAATVVKPTINGDSTFTYDGTEKTIAFNNYVSTKMTQAGDTAATNAGYYEVVFVPKSGYTWADGTTDEVILSWTIKPIELDVPVADSYEIPFDYSKSVAFTVTGFDSNTMTKSGTWSIGNSTAGNSYTATITTKDNYIFNTGSKTATYNWTIAPLYLPKPDWAQEPYIGSDNKLYCAFADVVEVDGDTVIFTVDSYTMQPNIYTGQKMKPHFGYYGFYVSSYTTITGDNLEQKNVGQYSATVSIRTSDSQIAQSVFWDDGTQDDVILKWDIRPVGVVQGKLYVDSFEYDGQVKSPISSTIQKYFDISGTTEATAIGEYSFTRTPKAGYVWSRNSYDYSPQTCKWYITGTDTVAKPTAAETTFTYSGSAQSLSISNYNATAMSQSGTTSATAPGTYNVTFSLKSGFTWVDGTTDNVVITWTINKVSVDKPYYKSSTFTYNGSAKSPTIINGDTTYINITGDTSATNAGSYSISFKLKNTTYYQWEDGTAGELILYWKILKMQISMPICGNGTDFIYDGSTKTPVTGAATTATGWANYVNISGTTSASARGAYTITYSLKDTTNTCWMVDGKDTHIDDIVINWNIYSEITPKIGINSYEEEYGKNTWEDDFHTVITGVSRAYTFWIGINCATNTWFGSNMLGGSYFATTADSGVTLTDGGGCVRITLPAANKYYAVTIKCLRPDEYHWTNSETDSVTYYFKWVTP